ncbi:MAG: hypothetical protein ABIF09_10315 [Gemmatimonadota bacterium]
MDGSQTVTGPLRVLELTPPFLAGLVAAVAMETSAGLLLYSDEGFLPALTLILTIEVGALGLGLWSGPLPVGGGVVEQVRRRWIFCLVAFALAAALSAGLSFMGDFPGSRIGQGVGLGFLGGLPLFSIGSLLGSMSRPDELGRPPFPLVGPPSALGGAIGFLLAGSVLLPHAAPYTLYLACMVALSGGALLQGWVLDGRQSVEVLEILSASTGELRVERRSVGRPLRELTVLLEGGRVRGAEDPDGRLGRAWEEAVLEGIGAGERCPDSVLYLGGGSGTLACLLSQRLRQTRIHVVERSPELVTLARSRFAVGEGWEGVGLQIGEPLTAPLGPPRSFSVIVVDCGALPTLGGAPFIGEAGWGFLVDALEVGGVVLMGGIPSRQGDPALPLGELIRSGRRWFEEVSLYQAKPVPLGTRLLPEVGDGAEILLLFSTVGAPAWPFSISAFQSRPAEEG